MSRLDTMVTAMMEPAGEKMAATTLNMAKAMRPVSEMSARFCSTPTARSRENLLK